MIFLKSYATYSSYVEVEFMDEIDTTITVNIFTGDHKIEEVRTSDFVTVENVVLAVEKAKEILKKWGTLNE